MALIKNLIRELAADADLWTDPVWVVDSTPVECARSRPTLRRSNLAGYSYCPSHSRFFWAPAAARGAPRPDSPHLGADRPELDERPVLMAIRDDDPTLTDQRIGLTIIGDKATSRPSSTGSSSNGV